MATSPLQFVPLQVCNLIGDAGKVDYRNKRTMTTQSSTITFHTQSAVDTTFWTTLANKKLDELKLSEAPIAIIGTLHGGVCVVVISSTRPTPTTGDYSVVPRAAIPAFVRVDHAAFQQHAHSTHPVCTTPVYVVCLIRASTHSANTHSHSSEYTHESPHTPGSCTGAGHAVQFQHMGRV